MAQAEFPYDFTKVIKDLDPSKMMEEVSKMLQQYKLPGIDMTALVASQKKNLEALTNANRVAFEGLQAVAKRQAAILQETMNEGSKAMEDISKAGSPPEVAAKQAEIAKSAFERALANMRELAEMVAKSNQEATAMINSRITATLDEIKDMALKMKTA
jgi:phasin family protein